jgi:hypothetical protein
MLHHDFQHIIASNINRALLNVSNNSNQNDTSDAGSVKVTTENNASTSGNNKSTVGTPQSLEAQLQFAMNNILCETEKNPVFGDILNNLFGEYKKPTFI